MRIIIHSFNVGLIGIVKANHLTEWTPEWTIVLEANGIQLCIVDKPMKKSRFAWSSWNTWKVCCEQPTQRRRNVGGKCPRKILLFQRKIALYCEEIALFLNEKVLLLRPHV